jgi:hypothetical protein
MTGMLNSRPSQLCVLDLSGTLIQDSDLNHILSSLTKLESLDLRNCDLLRSPSALCTLDVQNLFLDGNWRLEDGMIETLLCRHSSVADIMVVDLFGAVWGVGAMVQVVILTSRFEGRWVDARVSSVRDSTQTHRYDIFVEQTEEYENAVGFSGRPAFLIHRKHLRLRPGGTFFEGTWGIRSFDVCYEHEELV